MDSDAGYVVVKFSYPDYLRMKKLISKDEAMRQRSREKFKEKAGKSITPRQSYIKPVHYDVIEIHQLDPNNHSNE